MRRGLSRTTIAALAFLLGVFSGGATSACETDAECGCGGDVRCLEGVCVPAFTLPVFPLGTPGASAYATPLIAALDHAGGFYTGCCDDRITTFRGETAVRDGAAALCPAPPVFPACLFASCLCAYGDPAGPPFEVNGSYVGVVGPTHLSYDGHAGYDYEANAGTPLVATRDGQLCKALADPVNGTAGAPTAWEGFHTFYVDHGVIAGSGWASWYLHAEDLAGSLATLAPGGCAAVAGGEQVATAGNAGTFVPHLHFEVRRYDPADGPEAFSAKVVDPYGWMGAGPDPWSDPGANVQAAPQGPALWTACGNGRVECGETCDDGNTRDGDCCSASCTAVGAGTPCGPGPNACSDLRCDGAGACVETAAPRASCRRPIRSGAARLRIDRAGGEKDRLDWQWTHGAATNAADYGDPTGATSYRVCAFTDTPTPVLLYGATIPAGGQAWRPKGTPPGSRGYRYRNRERTPDGIEAVTLQPGVDGRAKLALKGRGAHLVLPPLPLPVPLRVQLSAGAGVCFEARYAAAGVVRSDTVRFDARGE